MMKADSCKRKQIDDLVFALRRRFPTAVAKSTGSLPSRPTGVESFDRLLPGGGLPLGRLSLLCGSISSGKMSLALAVAAGAVSTGRPVAWIDVSSSFHPPSATEAGLDLERVLLVQPPRGDLESAIHAAILLLRTGALSLLVLDLGMSGFFSPTRRQPLIGDDAAAKLGRSIASHTLCLCLSDERPPPAVFRISTLTISLDRRGCFWDEGSLHSDSEIREPSAKSPKALSGVAVTATILRSRLGGEGRAADLALRRATPSSNDPA